MKYKFDYMIISSIIHSGDIYREVLSYGVPSESMKAFIQGTHSPDNPVTVDIGNFSSISWDIVWELGLNEGHDYRLVSTSPLLFNRIVKNGGKIVIGSDVWIGKGCYIKSASANKPIYIADGAVVASDSVVVKDVPPYAIVGGNPAQIIKYRFSPEIIKSMRQIKWWEWSIDKIYANRQYFVDPEKFVSKFG